MNKPVYLEITPFFPTPDRFYGPYIYDQVKAIERNSAYEVIVVKLHPFYRETEAHEYTYQGTKVFNFKVIDLPSSTLPGILHFLNVYRFERFLREVIGISVENIAYIHAHSIYPGGALAVSLGEKYDIPSFIQHHGLDVFQLLNVGLLKGFMKKVNTHYMKKRFVQIANRADMNIGVSQKVLDRLIAEKGFENRRRYVLYNGVDTSKFYKISHSKKREGFSIGCIGNFFEIKDQITLVRAVHELKTRGITDIRVRFIGSGPKMKECRDYIAHHRLEEHFTFEKEVDHTKLNAFYNSLDLFVLPSYYEAFGCVYTEAMQTGVPVIAVKGQGIEEVLHEEEKDYSLIPKGDYRKLADLIEFRYNKRSKVDYNFDIDRYIKNFLNHVESMFPNKAPS